MVWELLDYVSDNGQNRIAEWYQSQGEEVQVVFDQTIAAICRMRDWSNRWQIKELFKEHAGLWEVRFKLGEGDMEVKYRPLGIVTRDARLSPVGQFIFLLGCHKRFGQYNPPNALDDALELKRQFEAGRGTLDDHL